MGMCYSNNKQTEVEGIIKPIITKLYQNADGAPSGEMPTGGMPGEMPTGGMPGGMPGFSSPSGGENIEEVD